ncbi:MAG TPA: trehalase family glycosidase [Terracidiphilus sp.]|nr:trehalase family glycosidase [Terracidiphilus sp.]
MKLIRALILAVLALLPVCIAPAQQTADSHVSAPDSAATLRYIHATWATLTRSMNECSSLADVKVAARPVLYVPAETPIPPEVASLRQQCNVELRKLPRRILKIGDLLPTKLSAQGLLYLPHPYVVPGGRFNEMYGWDSYFIVLGLEADHHEALAKGMVDNFFFEIEHYGGVLNANRTYYLTRSQPPFLTSMIRVVYENPASFPATPEGRAASQAWLEHAYEMAEKDYSTWTRPEHAIGRTGLARYFDYGSGPVPEMADDSTYYIDVIRWIVDHPHQGGEIFLVRGSEHPDAAETARLSRTSCDVHASVVCLRAWYGGFRLSRDFYTGDRAMRESGFDPSFRFGPFSGATQHFAPVGLNSLLFRYERDLEHFALLLGKPAEARRWERRAARRGTTIHRYMWNAREGVFADYDYVHHKKSGYAYLTSLYPLWAGVATRQEAASMVAGLSRFERPGGLSMSNYDSGLQWDEPFGWAPVNWMVAAGLDATGYRDDAQRIARKWNATVDRGFAGDGTLREKYNVETGNANVRLSAGYKANQIGFGWTNAVYLKMMELMREPARLGPSN